MIPFQALENRLKIYIIKSQIWSKKSVNLCLQTSTSSAQNVGTYLRNSYNLICYFTITKL